MPRTADTSVTLAPALAGQRQTDEAPLARRSRRRLGRTLALCLLAVVMELGQPRPARAGVRVGADAGYLFATGDFGDNTDPGLSVGASAYFTLARPHLSLGLTGSRVHFDSVRPIREPFVFGWSSTTLQASAQYGFLTVADRMEPYVGFDLGWTWYDYDWEKTSMIGTENEGTESGGGLSLAPAVGMRLFVTDMVAVDLSARWQWARTGTINFGDKFVSDAINGFAMRGGVAVMF